MMFFNIYESLLPFPFVVVVEGTSRLTLSRRPFSLPLNIKDDKEKKRNEKNEVLKSCSKIVNKYSSNQNLFVPVTSNSVKFYS